MRRVLKGEVVKKTDKTLKVVVGRTYLHPIYKKTVRTMKNYAVHNPENKFDEGDTVEIIESRPISKTKKWIVKYV